MGLFDSLFGRKKKPVEVVQVQVEPVVKVEGREEKSVRLTKKEKQEISMAHFDAAEREKNTAVALAELKLVNTQLVQEVKDLQKELRGEFDKNKEAHHYTQQLVSDTKTSVDSIKSNYAKDRQVEDIKREFAEFVAAVKKYIPSNDVVMKVKANNIESTVNNYFQTNKLQQEVLVILSSAVNREWKAKEIASAFGWEYNDSNKNKLNDILANVTTQGFVIRNEINQRNITYRINSSTYKKQLN